MADRPSLFIIGSPRSGTTFLTHLVNRFLDYHVSRDAGVFLRFFRLLPYYGDLARIENRRRLVNDLYGDYFFRQRFLARGLTLTRDQLLESVSEPTYPALVRAVLSAMAASHGKTGWGNKRPSYALRTDEFTTLFPASRVVHLIRDGRDVVLSMRRAADGLFEQNWYFAARDWRDHVLEGRRMGRSLGPDRYLEITYESLVRDPVARLSALLALLDADAESMRRLTAVADRVVAMVKSDNYDKWKRQMPPRVQLTVERAAGDLLRDAGYELAHPDLCGTPFSPLEIWQFRIDRLARKLLTRNVRKALSYRARQIATSGRALAGHLWPSVRT